MAPGSPAAGQAPSPRAVSPRRAPWAGSVWTVALGPIWAQPGISGTYFVRNFFLSRFPLNRLGAPFGHLFDLGLCFLQEVSAALAGLCNTSSQAAWAVGPVLPPPCWRLRGPVCPERKAFHPRGCGGLALSAPRPDTSRLCSEKHSWGSPRPAVPPPEK